MPADYPAELDVDLPTAYKRQFEQQMRAAVAVSAPWMLDAQQVQHRVADWMAGRLPSGDAVFFRRYHIRPLWHTGVEEVDLQCDDPMAEGVVEEDEVTYEVPEIGMRAGVDLVDAAGVSRAIVVKCSVERCVCKPEERVLRVSVSGAAKLRSASHSISQKRPLSALYFVASGLLVPERGDEPHSTFSDYVCHGHLHGLSEQQWDEVMGGQPRISYHSADRDDREHEQADYEQAAVSKDGMFPARYADVADKTRYRYLQRAEIRRMAAIASRLVMLDAGVDVAAFPCFQPVQMRRQFELVMQTRLETEVAGLPAPLPTALQGLVLEYYAPHVDIPL